MQNPPANCQTYPIASALESTAWRSARGLISPPCMEQIPSSCFPALSLPQTHPFWLFGSHHRRSLSLNFKPNQRDCISFPADDKPHRGLDLQSHDFIYLVPSWKTDKLAHPKAACARPCFITATPLSFHEELEMLKLLTIKAEHFRNERNGTEIVKESRSVVWKSPNS